MPERRVAGDRRHPLHLPVARCRSPTRRPAVRPACTRSTATGATTSRCDRSSSACGGSRARRDVRGVPRLRRAAQRLSRTNLHLQHDRSSIRRGLRVRASTSPSACCAARYKGRRAPARDRGYLEFLRTAAACASPACRSTCMRGILHCRLPILTGLSSTYLYRSAREFGADGTPDDIRGHPAGHFVVIAGWDDARGACWSSIRTAQSVRDVARILDRHRSRARGDPARHRHPRREPARRVSAPRRPVDDERPRRRQSRRATGLSKSTARAVVTAREYLTDPAYGENSRRASSTCAAPTATRAAAITCRCSPRRAATARCPR